MKVEAARTQMVDQQIRTWDVLNERVLNVIAETPREAFVPPVYLKLAFADIEIPLAHGQAMLAPKIVGRLLQALDIRHHDEILQIGTGNGFLCACLAKLGRSVLSVDPLAEFGDAAGERLAKLAIDNVTFLAADGLDHRFEQRFDVIAVRGSLPQPAPQLEQLLRPGGRLFVVVGRPPVMDACLICRVGDEEWDREVVLETVLPPLTNTDTAAQFDF